MAKTQAGAHAAQNRFAVIAQANGVVRILQRFSTRTEAEAFVHVSQKTPGIGQLSIQDLAAAAPSQAPEFMSQAAIIRARREEDRRQRPVSPQLLLAVLLLFGILLGGLGLLYLINEHLLPGL